ncbi:SEC-C metal-binding domain-containing protein [Sphingomonas aurantiaca]|uniref:SEC-C metal-binding domain-containing protein n=1 Tax=Sphingomonas aurantiaca TaxID=185949 RepID=UPI002FE27457
MSRLTRWKTGHRLRLVEGVLQLHAARSRATPADPAPTPDAVPVKLGRNDPCRCGSGKKVKRCCG